MKHMSDTLDEFLLTPLNQLSDHQIASILSKQIISRHMRGDPTLPGNQQIIDNYTNHILSEPARFAAKKKEIAMLLAMHNPAGD
jgi:hypothetical protein